MFKNLKLRDRILLGYLVPFILLLTTMGMVYSALSTAAKENNLLNETASFTPDVLIAGDSLVRIQRAAYAYVLMNGKTGVVGGYPKKIFENSEARFKSLLEKLTRNNGESAHQDKLRSLADVGGNIIRVNRNYMILVDAGKEKEAIAEFRRGESVKLASQIDPLVDGIMKVELDRRTKLHASVAEAMALAQNSVLVGTICAIVLMVVFGLWTATLISRTIREAIGTITTSSTEIAATVAQHERTVTQQAAAVNETTATVEELGVSSRQSAEQAETMAASAKQTQNVTEEGVRLANRAYGGMTGMKEKVGAVAEQILRLSEQAGQIGTIATAVSELASETNMLALNAAVEAARAGEHGKGFAVVAAEVRKLAEQSKKSAQRANALVADIQKATNSAVMVTEDGTRTAEEAAAIVQQAGDAFTSLSAIANGVYENAQQVMLNGKQQAAALIQVTEAMKSLGAGSKEMAAGTAQTKIGVEKLNEVALSIKAMI